MKCYIGIDLGGTNVRVAKVTQDGEVLAQVKGPSYGTEGPAKVMANIKALVHQIPDWQEASGIGVGVPGRSKVRYDGIVYQSDRLCRISGCSGAFRRIRYAGLS